MPLTNFSEDYGSNQGGFGLLPVSIQVRYIYEMRRIKTIGIVVFGYFLAGLASAIVVASGVDSTGNSGSGVALITLILFWGYLATKTGYRWFDFLFLLIPLYGIFWVFRIAYRIAYLPRKDWTDLGEASPKG